MELNIKKKNENLGIEVLLEAALTFETHYPNSIHKIFAINGIVRIYHYFVLF
jgi:hypothetical protein